MAANARKSASSLNTHPSMYAITYPVSQDCSNSEALSFSKAFLVAKASIGAPSGGLVRMQGATAGDRRALAGQGRDLVAAAADRYHPLRAGSQALNVDPRLPLSAGVSIPRKVVSLKIATALLAEEGKSFPIWEWLRPPLTLPAFRQRPLQSRLKCAQ
jgi:hypothetical protein